MVSCVYADLWAGQEMIPLAAFLVVFVSKVNRNCAHIWSQRTEPHLRLGRCATMDRGRVRSCQATCQERCRGSVADSSVASKGKKLPGACPSCCLGRRFCLIFAADG